ncbi:hypothetical protein ODZ83_11175, partial [Acaricomes phytoseiuli]|uniref:hypothetical protein n=1 Tax=Acaricomes phytoseiuli TaxID=291968 RepID=UPI002221F088
GQEPVPELGVVAVGIEQRVRTVGLPQLGVGDRGGQPPVVGLAGDLQDPTLNRPGLPRVWLTSDL